MTLSAAKEVARKVADLHAYPVAASTTIYKGSLVCLDSSGYAVAGNDTDTERFIGIAYETVANTAAGNSAGDLWIRVNQTGIYKLAATGTITQAMVGRVMFVVTSGTFNYTSSNKIPMGRLVEYVSATEGWVDIGQRSDVNGYQDHVYISVDKSDKNVRLNCKTFVDAASIVGVQTKPRAAVTMTDDIAGLESMPGINSGFAGKGIKCFKAEPYWGSTALTLSGDAIGYEATLGKPTGAGVVSGTIAALKAINNCNNAGGAITGGVYPLWVTAPGDNQAWGGLAKIDVSSGIAHYASGGHTAAGNVKFWMKMTIDGQTAYFLGYDTVPT